MAEQSLQLVKQRRQEQLREQTLFSLLSQLEEHNVTLVELSEFYTTKYASRINANRLQSNRSRTRRKEINQAAIKTRWQRQYDFLAGSSTYADKLKRLGSGTVKTELPTPDEKLTPPKAEFVPAEPSEQPSSLDDTLNAFGGF